MTGCNLPNPFDPGPNSKEDTAPPDGDTAADTGTDTGTDTGFPNPAEVELFDTISCEWKERSDYTFGNGTDYYEPPGQAECYCKVDLVESNTSLGDSIFVSYAAAATSKTYVPQGAAGRAPWGDKLMSDANETIYSSWEWEREFDLGDDELPWGGWYAMISRLNQDTSGGVNHYTDCEDYADVDILFRTFAKTNAVPVRRPVTPLGAEDDLDCASDETYTTRFRLSSFPHVKTLVPLAISGDEEYAGSRVKSVTVTTWNNADEVRIRRLGTEHVLTPNSPSVNISADTWWLGTNRWSADRTADNAAFTNPVVELDLECPTTAVGDIVNRPQGYGMSLQQLAAAVDDATDDAGIGGLIASAPDPTIPVYAFRIDPVSNPASGGPTHLLRLELRGTWARVSLPITETSQDNWSFSYDSYWEDNELEMEGTITKSGQNLTFSLSSGSWTDTGGTITFDPASLVLGALGAN